MPLVTVVLVLIVVGVLLWLVETQIPLDATIKRLIRVLVIVCVVLWLLSLFLPIGALNAVRVGRT